MTNTVMVDFWSYNHYIFTGAVVWYVTKSATISLIASALDAAISFKLADWTAPLAQKVILALKTLLFQLLTQSRGLQSRGR